ncbi:MAG: PAS domain-containing protein [Ilumatobacteraceae bacterium]
MSRKEGEFTLLLNEGFDILWHSESLSRILGWGDITGRSGSEFVHPDDLGRVRATMIQVNSGDDQQGFDPTFAPEPADIRIADANGRWHPFETTTWNHLDAGDVKGVLCTYRRIYDRSEHSRMIEMR